MSKQIHALALLLLCLSSATPAENHPDVVCNANETECQISDSKIWPVGQTGDGCWCAATIILIQCKYGYENESYLRSEVMLESGLTCSEENPVGLFGYCDRDDQRGMKHLLSEIGGIDAQDEVYLDPPPERSDETHCVSKVSMPTEAEIMEWIKDKRAFAVALRYGEQGNSGHIVVVHGYDASDGEFWVKYMDPLLGRATNAEYSKWLEDTWGDRRIISNALIPYDPLPVGIEDRIYITSGPQHLIHPGSAVTYTSYFEDLTPFGDYADTWDWRLEFDHSGGTYVLAQGTVSGYNGSSWHVQAGPLPTGYDWNLTSQGHVIGRAKVSTTDNGGTSHSTYRDITFDVPNPSAPQLAYPSDEATGIAISPTLQWQAAAGATSYHLQVSRDRFLPPCRDIAGIGGTTRQVLDLLPTTAHHWRVGATNQWGTRWSDWQVFMTLKPDAYVLEDEHIELGVTVSTRNSLTVRNTVVSSETPTVLQSGGQITINSQTDFTRYSRVDVVVDPALQ